MHLVLVPVSLIILSSAPLFVLPLGIIVIVIATIIGIIILLALLLLHLLPYSLGKELALLSYCCPSLSLTSLSLFSLLAFPDNISNQENMMPFLMAKRFYNYECEDAQFQFLQKEAW